MANDLIQTKSQKHPPGLYLLFFTEMWERFSYYGMRGLLMLYLTKTVAEGGLNWNEGDAGLLYGYFTGFVYFTPLLGGYIADKYLGQRNSIFIGGVLMMIAQFCLFFQVGLFELDSIASASGGKASMYMTTVIGLLLLIIGNGFFKPNISVIVGQLYEDKDPRRDGAFTIFYMGINLGAFLAPLVCGYLAEDFFAVKTMVDGKEVISTYAFNWGFFAAGIGMLLGQITYMSLGKKFLGNIGVEPASKSGDAASRENIDKPLTKEEKDRITVIMVLLLFVTIFWAGFEQAGSSLSIYTDKYIDRSIDMFNFTIPTSWFQSVNPLFIVLLGGAFTYLWKFLSDRNSEPSTPIKMGFGMILLGVGFLFMVGASMSRGGDTVVDEAIKAPLFWLVMTYLFHTMGELCLSPVGLSMVTKLAPVKLASLLMGAWFLSSFLANVLGGYLVEVVSTMGPMKIFGIIAMFVIVLGIVLFGISKTMVRMMHGQQ